MGVIYLLSRTTIFLTNVSVIESYKESKIISFTTQRILRLKVSLSHISEEHLLIATSVKQILQRYKELDRKSVV